MPKDDDRRCPCGVSHTIAEHNYDPDKHDGPDPDLSLLTSEVEVVFYNVNEEDAVYDRHNSLDAALSVLKEFPNDSIVVVSTGSHVERKMHADYKRNME